MSPTRRSINHFLKKEGIDPATGKNMELIAGGGSDRCFYRVASGRNSYVVMTAPSFRYDIRSYVDVGRFLYERGVGVPEILAYDDERQLVLLEDLGDLSLYQALNEAETRGEVVRYYKQVLDRLAEMVVRTSTDMETCDYLKHRSFGYEALRWETDYFIECFLKRFCGVALENEGRLEDECHMLALRLAEERRFFMHRDFQSKNVYLHQGQVRFIDFQTATRGLLQYDLASLLKDSYFVLSDDEREELVEYYRKLLADEGKMDCTTEDFLALFHRTGLQRTMQALGAFAFLGMDKGKTDFLEYIAPGIGILSEALKLFPEYDELGRVVDAAGGILEQKPDLLKMK